MIPLFCLVIVVIPVAKADCRGINVKPMDTDSDFSEEHFAACYNSYAMPPFHEWEANTIENDRGYMIHQIGSIRILGVLLVRKSENLPQMRFTCSCTLLAFFLFPDMVRWREWSLFWMDGYSEKHSHTWKQGIVSTMRQYYGLNGICLSFWEIKQARVQWIAAWFFNCTLSLHLRDEDKGSGYIFVSKMPRRSSRRTEVHESAAFARGRYAK